MFNGDNDLDSEIKLYYNDNNQVSSYEYTDDLNNNSPTYVLATFSYAENQVLHCDGKHWSSVEYKDVYDSIWIYRTNDYGDFVQANALADCDISAAALRHSDVTTEYADTPSPFINMTGNDAILHTIIGAFTSSTIHGVQYCNEQNRNGT